MKLEHADITEVKAKITEILSRHLEGPYKLFFFGSRVSGKSHERSDIDIGIEADKPIPVHIMAAMKEELEDLPYLYTFELVDFKRVSSEFRKVAEEAIDSIN